MSKGEITADEFNQALHGPRHDRRGETGRDIDQHHRGSHGQPRSRRDRWSDRRVQPVQTGRDRRHQRGSNGRDQSGAHRRAGIADVLRPGQGHRSVHRLAVGRAVGRRRPAIIVERHHGGRERDDRRTAGGNRVRQRAQHRRHGRADGRRLAEDRRRLDQSKHGSRDPPRGRDRRSRGGRHRRHHRHADCRRRSSAAQRGHGREPDHAGHHAHRRARGRTHLLLHLHQHRQGRVVELHGFHRRLCAGHHRLLHRSRLHHRRDLQLGRERCEEHVERRGRLVPWTPGLNRRVLLRTPAACCTTPAQASSADSSTA